MNFESIIYYYKSILIIRGHEYRVLKLKYTVLKLPAQWMERFVGENCSCVLRGAAYRAEMNIGGIAKLSVYYSLILVSFVEQTEADLGLISPYTRIDNDSTIVFVA